MSNEIVSELAASEGRTVRAKAEAIPHGDFLAACVKVRKAGGTKDDVAAELSAKLNRVVTLEQVTGKLNSPVPEAVAKAILANPKFAAAVPMREVERTFTDPKTKLSEVRTVKILDLGFTASRASADLSELDSLLGDE